MIFDEFRTKMTDITKGCSVSYSSNRYMEFNKEGVDKGVGLQHLADQLGIKIEETIGVGDNYNDMAMLKKAGLAVAAGNAVEDMLKKHVITQRMQIIMKV